MWCRGITLQLSVTTYCYSHADLYEYAGELYRMHVKDGTTTCHRYCTACVVSHRSPVTLAIIYVRSDGTEADTVDCVIDRVAGGFRTTESGDSDDELFDPTKHNSCEVALALGESIDEDRVTEFAGVAVGATEGLHTNEVKPSAPGIDPFERIVLKVS